MTSTNYSPVLVEELFFHMQAQNMHVSWERQQKETQQGFSLSLQALEIGLVGPTFKATVQHSFWKVEKTVSNLPNAKQVNFYFARKTLIQEIGDQTSSPISKTFIFVLKLTKCPVAKAEQSKLHFTYEGQTTEHHYEFEMKMCCQNCINIKHMPFQNIRVHKHSTQVSTCHV